MKNIETSGRVQTIMDTQQITLKFRKREFVIVLDADGKYPQPVLFQMTGDRCESLDKVGVGDEVEIEFSLRGREWTSPKGEVRYFNSLDCWVVRVVQSALPEPDVGPPDESTTPVDDSEIPF